MIAAFGAGPARLFVLFAAPLKRLRWLKPESKAQSDSCGAFTRWFGVGMSA